jgi:hypothetical protein
LLKWPYAMPEAVSVLVFPHWIFPKYLREQLKRRKDWFWLTIFQVAVHYGGRGRGLWQIEEAHVIAVKKPRRTMLVLEGFLLYPLPPFPLLFHSVLQPMEWCCPHLG